MIESTYTGDDEYSINCTGDVVTGDSVRFERSVFTGTYRNAHFAGFERITGVIIRDSYGKDKQQHTFTLELPDGHLMRIKGRNLYKETCWRTPWEDESSRGVVLDEKHRRGDVAREIRNERNLNYECGSR